MKHQDALEQILSLIEGWRDGRTSSDAAIRGVGKALSKLEEAARGRRRKTDRPDAP